MLVGRGKMLQGWDVTLFSAGFIVLLVGMVLMAVGSLQYGDADTSFGGVVFIGPIPILLGRGPQSPVLLTIGLMLAIGMGLFFLSTFLSRKGEAVGR